MPKVPTCPGCGAPMLKYISKEGQRLFICGNKSATHLKTLKGKIIAVEVACEGVDGGPLEVFTARAKDKVTVKQLQASARFVVPTGTLVAEANRAMRLDMPPEVVAEMFEAFVTLGLGTGRAPERAIKDGVNGACNQNGRQLGNIGIHVSRKLVKERYPDLESNLGWMKFTIDEARRLMKEEVR